MPAAASLMTDPRISVVVADDHPLYRDGLVNAINAREDLELVGQADDGAGALELISERLPDCRTSRRQDGRGRSRRCCVALQNAGASTKVVFLSAYLDSALIYSTLEAGAAGFLSKRAERSAICDALVAAASGEIVLSPEIQTALGREIRSNGRANRPALTPREQEVLVLAAEGLSAARIGERLFLSPATVKTHLAHLTTS